MVDALAALVAITRGQRPVSTWPEHVADLADAVGARLHGSVLHPSGERQGLPVVQVPPKPADGRDHRTMIYVVVWRHADLAETADARVSALVRAAKQQRQNATDDLRSGLLAVLVGDDPAGEPAEFDDLLTVFDTVALGRVGDTDRWSVRQRGTGTQQAADFAAAVGRLTEDPPAVVRPSEPEPEPEPAAARPPRFLLIAGEWGSQFGGLSTLNRGLATALAAAGVEVHVCVPAASPAEVEPAAAVGVSLVAPDPIPGVTGRELLLAGPRIADDYQPDVIVGHARFYGPYAYGLQNTVFGRAAPKRVHVVHVDPERLEAAKEEPGGDSRMMTAAERRELEGELAVSADLVVGVGPLLTETITSEIQSRSTNAPEVFDLWPGLPDWKPVDRATAPPPQRRVLLIARAEDVTSKGIDIAVTALREVTRRQADLDHAPILTIRGVPENDPEDVVKRLHTLAGSVMEVAFRPYTADEKKVQADLRAAWLVIMPSRHEGFGLAAYEAIAMGVPVLITQDSGLARMLKKILGGTPPEVVPVRGSRAEIQTAWANAISHVVMQPREAFDRAAWLLDRLRQEVSWPKAAAGLLDRLGVDRSALTPRSP